MSSIYSQESADSVSASNEPECEPSRSAKSSRSAGRSSKSIGPSSPVTKMSENSPQTGLWPTPRANRVELLPYEDSTERSSTEGYQQFLGDCGVDIICGGFPCQDISVAGKGAGIEGSRSGLWSEYARIISEVRPRYVIVENVAALLGRGLERVLGDLAALGFDAEWHCIPASAVGAPHRRDRVWIVAYAGSEQHKGSRTADERPTAEGFL